MAETVGDVSGKLDQLELRVRTVETITTSLDTSIKTSVSLAKWIFGGSLVGLGISILVAVGGFFWTFMEMRTSVAVQAKDIAHLEKYHLENGVRLERTLAEKTGQAEKAVEKIEARLAKRIDDLDSKNLARTNLPFHRIYDEHVSKISRVGKDSLTTEERDRQIKTEKTFPIAPGARVLIKGKGAGIEELRPGMTVVLLFKEDGAVQLIEQIAEQKKKFSDLPPPPDAKP